MSRERLYHLLGIYAKDQGSNSLVFFCLLQKFQKGGVADKIRVCAGSKVVS